MCCPFTVLILFVLRGYAGGLLTVDASLGVTIAVGIRGFFDLHGIDIGVSLLVVC